MLFRVPRLHDVVAAQRRSRCCTGWAGFTRPTSAPPGTWPSLTASRPTARCLDDDDLAPDVVKIDVQGYEEAVVRGGWRTLSEHRPVLVVEVPTPALRTLLGQELGYTAREWRGGRLEGSRGVQVDQVFLPPARRGDPAPD